MSFGMVSEQPRCKCSTKFSTALWQQLLYTLSFGKWGSARHLYVVCIYGAICLQIQKCFPPDRAVFSPKNVILIRLYVVSRFMKKKSRYHGKVAMF
jgi:hypothetical protein